MANTPFTVSLVSRTNHREIWAPFAHLAHFEGGTADILWSHPGKLLPRKGPRASVDGVRPAWADRCYPHKWGEAIKNRSCQTCKITTSVCKRTRSSLSLTLVHPHVLKCPACSPPTTCAFFPQLHRAIFCYIGHRALGKGGDRCDLELPVHTHSSSLSFFWRVPYSVGDCMQSCPFIRLRNLRLPSQLPSS